MNNIVIFNCHLSSKLVSIGVKLQTFNAGLALPRLQSTFSFNKLDGVSVNYTSNILLSHKLG